MRAIGCIIAFIFITLLSALSAATETKPFKFKPVGMFNVYFSVDEALGYLNVRDDIAEVKEAGINLITHYFMDENVRTFEGKFWYGLEAWLGANPDKAAELNNWRAKYGYSLDWKLFFWSRYLREAYAQGQGEVKVLVGEMYGMFAATKSWDDLKTFVIALCEFEEKHCPETIAGWYIAEEPTSMRKRYSSELCQEVMERIRKAEVEINAKRHAFYLDTTADGDEEKLVSFVRGVDVIMISPDAYIWATYPATYVEEAQYENIPHAIRRMRELAAKAQNSEASIHIVLQAYDWNKEGPLQPSHINMHQQVRYALQRGIANRGKYGLNPSWVEPAAGIWFWWWHDVKSEKRTPDGKLTVINRWDEGTEGSWKEAIKSELSGENGAVTLRGKEAWSGKVHIIGDVILSESATLTLKAGAQVKFAPIDYFKGGKDPQRCELTIKGKLVGETDKYKKEPIVFSSDSRNKRITPFPRSPRNRDWYGIRLEGKKADFDFSSIIIEHAIKSTPEKGIK